MPSDKAIAAQRAREGPKKETGGNSVCDQEWIAEMLAAGELHEPDEETRPPEFLYSTIYQWDGLNEDLNPDFFEYYRPKKGVSEVPRQCNGSSYVRDRRGGYVVDAEWQRLRRHCLGRPARGTNVCHAHGSQIPQVKAAAQQRLAEAAEVVALRLIGLTGVRDEDKVRIRPQDRIMAANSVLDRAGVRGGTELEITTPGYQKVLQKMFGDDDEPNA